jgi:hypothetical protein
VIHTPHAHVSHRAHRARIHRRDWRRHARARREGAAGIAAAILGLGENRVGPVSLGLDDHVIGFGDADAELVDRDWHDIVAVRLDDRHWQAIDAHVENAHRRAVDEAQPHPFAGTEQRRPVGGGPLPVDEVGVGGARDVEDVGRAHPHFSPLEAVGNRRAETVFLGILNERAERTLPIIVVVALEFEIADDRLGRLKAPIGEQ